MRQLNIHCTKGGIRVDGANNIGSTSSAVISSRYQFRSVCEHWWNTYCEGYGDPAQAFGGKDSLSDLLEELRSGEYAPLADRVEAAVNENRGHALDVLNRVHDYLGELIRDSLVEDTPRASDLADDVWDVIHGVGKKEGVAE